MAMQCITAHVSDACVLVFMCERNEFTFQLDVVNLYFVSLKLCTGYFRTSGFCFVFFFFAKPALLHFILTWLSRAIRSDASAWWNQQGGGNKRHSYTSRMDSCRESRFLFRSFWFIIIIFLPLVFNIFNCIRFRLHFSKFTIDFSMRKSIIFAWKWEKYEKVIFSLSRKRIFTRNFCSENKTRIISTTLCHYLNDSTFEGCDEINTFTLEIFGFCILSHRTIMCRERWNKALNWPTSWWRK